MKHDAQILMLLERQGNLSHAEIGVMLNLSETEVDAAIARLKADGVLLGKTAIINWEKTEHAIVTALIEVRVTPQRDLGFDAIAERLCRYPQVRSCYLMSGGFDLMIIVEDTSLKSVALFVSEKIAIQDTVQSTATHFILKQYKEHGIIFAAKDEEHREPVVL